jgi:hypothetical protein
MNTSRFAAAIAVIAAMPLLLSACALRSADVQPLHTDPSEFAGWSCERMREESDRVQRVATRLAYAFDERAGNNIAAMGIGLAVFWPALLTMRSQGPDATVLASLKGRHEALTAAAATRACDSAADGAVAAQGRPLGVDDRVVYEQRLVPGAPLQTLTVRVAVMRRDRVELASLAPGSESASADWLSDALGNLLQAPSGPVWPSLLRSDLELGALVGGVLRQPSDDRQWARVRGQVVAVGPQLIGGARFDVAVIELFGDAHDGDTSTRLDGVLVVDRGTGLHLRLDLFSSHAGFGLQRRLTRVERAAP